MNDLFENLYHQSYKENTTEIENLLSLIKKHKITLRKKLNKENFEVLQKLIDCTDELQELYFRKNFKNGFSLGIKIATEFFL